MKWTQTIEDFVLETDVPFEQGDICNTRGLDSGVRALFIIKGNERRLYKVWFSRKAKNPYPFSGHVFKTLEDCQRWISIFAGKIIGKVEGKQKINRYEASSLLTLQSNIEGVLETYALFGKNEKFISMLQTKTRINENVSKKVKRKYL